MVVLEAEELELVDVLFIADDPDLAEMYRPTCPRSCWPDRPARSWCATGRCSVPPITW